MRCNVLLVSVCALAAALVAGCGDGDTVGEFSDVRVRATPRYEAPGGIGHAERFGLAPAGGHGGMHGAPGDPHGSIGAGQGPTFTWKLPEGWDNMPAAGMRKGSWRVHDQPLTDCSLTVLSGGGGGDLANVNRWRAEMNLEPIDKAGLQKIASHTLLSQPALYVKLAGHFSGGRGAQGAIENAGMLGLILQAGSSAIFLKFTGPADIVQAQAANFEALAASIEAQAPPARSPAAGAKGGASANNEFEFDTPDGWTLEAARMMRIATFAFDDLPSGWCYVSRLSMDGGGLVANINRWQGEMGQGQLDEAAIAKLRHVDVLGTPSPLLDLTGDFRGTGGPAQKGARMFGLICMREGYVLFIKAAGPADKMQGQLERFLQFSKSIREKK